jgi:hypothetical protein
LHSEPDRRVRVGEHTALQRRACSRRIGIFRGRLREDVLDRNNHQGWYGECFVQALAAATGFTVAKESPDLTGIDFQIKSTREVGDDFPRMEVQVKSWSAPNGDDRLWHYRGLTEKQFNHLAGRRIVPAFLSW